MRFTPFAIALALALAQLAALPARAEDEIWVWTTTDGAVHYTDELERVPDEFRASARVAHKEGAGSYQRVSGGAPAAAAGDASGAKGAATPAAPPGDSDAASESVWRAEAREIDARIAALSERVATCAGDHVNLSPGDGSRKRREEHAEAEACARARADLALATSDREALEERAQRASVPPGWLRTDD
ncbi:MAG TPA: hypothetical protein VII78_02855 [Myxococcota bacterium]